MWQQRPPPSALDSDAPPAATRKHERNPKDELPVTRQEFATLQQQVQALSEEVARMTRAATSATELPHTPQLEQSPLETDATSPSGPVDGGETAHSGLEEDFPDEDLRALAGRAAEKLGMEWLSDSLLDDALDQRPLPRFPEVAEEVHFTWGSPLSAPDPVQDFSSVMNVDGADRDGYLQFPPLIAGKTPVQPSKDCQMSVSLFRKAYLSAGAGCCALSTLGLLQEYQLALLRDLPASPCATVVTEIRRAADMALRLTHCAAQAMGRAMGACVVGHRHLWLTEAGVPERDRAPLLDAPYTAETPSEVLKEVKVEDVEAEVEAEAEAETEEFILTHLSEVLAEEEDDKKTGEVAQLGFQIPASNAQITDTGLNNVGRSGDTEVRVAPCTSTDVPLACFSPSVTDTRSPPLLRCRERDADSSLRPAKKKRLEAEKDVPCSTVAKEMIEGVLQQKPGGASVQREYKLTGTLSDSSRRKMVNILAAHMTEIEGRIPLRQTREKYALGIVTLFPSLRDPLSKNGYEHFYDGQNGTGFLAWRLKTIQRKKSGKHAKRAELNGGPRNVSRDVGHFGSELQEDGGGGGCVAAILALSDRGADRDLVFQKMRETFGYRRRLVNTPEKQPSDVLAAFPRLLDTKGLILQDFSLLFGADTAAKLLNKWGSSFKEKVIQEAGNLTSSPFLHKLLKAAENKPPGLDDSPGWDSDMSSILLLLHLLSPQPCGRNRTQKMSVRDAVNRLVRFRKSCRSLEEHVSETEGQHHPYLLASGASEADVRSWHVVLGGRAIPCQAATSLAAFDELFKAHFVFGVPYDDPLTGMFTFLQTTVYNIDVGNTKESPRVRELRARLLNRDWI